MRSVRRGQPDQSLALLEGSQFPTRTPIRSLPSLVESRRLNSGLNKPESAALKATLRTAARGRLIVVGAYLILL